jgi:hypothetical protein
VELSAARDDNRAVTNSGEGRGENSCSPPPNAPVGPELQPSNHRDPIEFRGRGALLRWKIKVGLIEAPEHPRPRYRLLCCALWIDDGAMPKYLRNTRLKCEELEKPHENATSVMVLPPWVSSSWRQCCSLACQI